MSFLGWLAGISLVLALEVLAVSAWVSRFVPIVYHNPSTGRVEPLPPGLEPERETTLYFIFLVCAVLIFIGSLRLFQKRNKDKAFVSQLKVFLGLELFWTVLMLFAGFKWITYQYPFYQIWPSDQGAWVTPLFLLAVVSSLMTKVFWPEIYKGIRAGFCWVNQVSFPVFLVAAADAGWLFFIAGLLYVPGLNAKVNHNLCYGIVYVAGVYGLLRIMTRRFWISAAASLMFMKMSLFGYDAQPLVWAVGIEKIVPFYGDIVVIALLTWVARKKKWAFFAIAAPAALALAWAVMIKAAQALTPLPLFYPLRVRQFFPFFYGFFVPAFYAIVASASVGYVVATKEMMPWLLTGLVACYGLICWALYIIEPSMFAYGKVILPMVLLSGLLTSRAVSCLKIHQQRPVEIALCLAAFGFLITNRFFILYPHFGF